MRNLCCGYSWFWCFPCNSPFVACLGNGMCPKHWKKARKGPFLGSTFKTTFAKQIQHTCNILVRSAPSNTDKPGTVAVLCESPTASKDALPILKSPSMLNAWLIPWEAFCIVLFQQPARQLQISCADPSISPSPCLWTGKDGKQTYNERTSVPWMSSWLD